MNYHSTIKPEQILRGGHNSFETAYKVDNYPYGYSLRTSIFYWIESKKGKGDRFVSCTMNPKTGLMNKPKAGIYYPFIFMYLDAETNHVKFSTIDSYKTDEFKDKVDFIVNVVKEINDVQIENLRKEHYLHLKAEYGYKLVKYSDDIKPLYTEWIKNTLKHIGNSEFYKMATYPAPPEENNPAGEVEVKITERFI